MAPAAVQVVQAIAVEGKDEKKPAVKWLKHYSSGQSILVVGDGDLSFSLALATAFSSGANLVATSLDSYTALICQYSKAESNVTQLKGFGATVLHGVDAEQMKNHTCLKMRRFDRIVFNFPHAGFVGRYFGYKEVEMVDSHKELVNGFLRNARHLLQPYGEIHISHKTGHPYDAWDIEQLASGSPLIMLQKVPFHKHDYPGYNQKRGYGAKCNRSFPLGDSACTFKFCMKRAEAEDSDSALVDLVVDSLAKMNMSHGQRNVAM